MSIRQLPQHVIDKIKSSVTITSLNGVACGLLTNALDAGASDINITVDYTRGNCTVEDNGLGIPPAEFSQGGGLGKLHHTSRFPSRSSNHGKNGDFLASLATLSLLFITSRHQSHLSHNSITIHNSNVLARNLPAPPAHRLVNSDHGTNVTVRDLFGSMPVRVKQRATATERPTIDREWAKLMREVVALLLAWPSAVAVSLRNTTTRRELRFRPFENSDLVSRTFGLLVQASLVDSSNANSWVPIAASSGSTAINGCISKVPAATRRSQFISLGVHPVMNEFGTDVLYEEINRVFQNSSFGTIEENDNQPRNSAKLDGLSGRELRTRKGIEKWPIFYFKIVAAGYTEADTFDKLENQNRTLATILDLLRASCYGFLKKHRYRPRKVKLSPDESALSTSKTLGRTKQSQCRAGSSTSSSRSDSLSRNGDLESQARVNSPFDGWHRVKIGRPTTSVFTKTVDIRTSQPDAEASAPLVGEGGKLLRRPFDETSNDPSGEIFPDSQENGRMVPTTGSLVITGSGLPAFDGSSFVGPGTCAEQSKRMSPQPNPQSKWLQNVTHTWKNPVFETSQPLIPSLDCGGDALHHCSKGGDGGVLFDVGSMNLTGRVSRRALAHGTAISQVDRKFILVKLPLEKMTPGDSETQKSSSALVILDQHAVDERCRLEELMAGYFLSDIPGSEITPDVEVLERPLVFEVSPREHQLLEQYRDYFGSWGIVYSLTSHLKRLSNVCKATIAGLPPSILERCRQEPRLLIELLRKEIWQLVDGDLVRPHYPSSQSDKAWISRFHGCPKGILEMLHSRACRSAIMFNDLLTNEDCKHLLSRLSKCVLPFQCAHGRPSMVPLVDVGTGGKFGQWQEDREGTAGCKWKTWITESKRIDKK